MKHEPSYVKHIGEQFRIPGEFAGAGPYGTGHINDTYASRWRDGNGEQLFIQQRINHTVFKDPPRLMENIERVTAHLRAKILAGGNGNPERETMTVIPTRDGASFFRDEQGNYWRTYIFIRDACTLDVCGGPAHAFEAARMFAKFQKMLADLPGERLHDTIPNFHHAPMRFKALEAAAEKDCRNRRAAAEKELEFAFSEKPMTTVVSDLIAKGEIPERVSHNDTKINNVMVDAGSYRGVCVIDLDTVMTGTVLYDFGDMVRTMTRAAPEDEQDLERVFVDMDLFEAMLKGYLAEARGMLTKRETELLAFSGKLLCFVIGLRFLTDYLSGDVYFKTHRKDHNLERARVQFKMARDIQAKESRMEKIVRDNL